MKAIGIVRGRFKMKLEMMAEAAIEEAGRAEREAAAAELAENKANRREFELANSIGNDMDIEEGVYYISTRAGGLN
jgi:hypothetical protein